MPSIRSVTQKDRLLVVQTPLMTPKPKLESVSLLSCGGSLTPVPACSLSLFYLPDCLILINGPVRVGFHLLG